MAENYKNSGVKYLGGSRKKVIGHELVLDEYRELYYARIT